MSSKAGAGFDSAENRVALGRRHLAFLNAAGEDAGDGLEPLVDELLLDVVHDDVQAAHGGHLGDAVAHLARADDSEDVHFHVEILLYGMAKDRGFEGSSELKKPDAEPAAFLNLDPTVSPPAPPPPRRPGRARPGRF
jgi:hypothetical protein